MEPPRRRLHLRHERVRHGSARRHGADRLDRHDGKVSRGRRGAVCVQSGVDEAEHSAHVLPHFPVSLFQEDGVWDWGVCGGVGDLHYVSVYLYLCAGREAVVPRSSRTLYRSGWHVDCQRRVDDSVGSGHSVASPPTGMEAALAEGGEDWCDHCLWPRVFVRAQHPLLCFHAV